MTASKTRLRARRRGPLCVHCAASDPVWESARRPRSLVLQSTIRGVLYAAQASAILPPPPGRLRALQAVVLIAAMCLATVASQLMFVNDVKNKLEEQGGLQLALHAYLIEDFLEAVQPGVILASTACNLRRFAKALAAVLAPTAPLRAAPSFIVFSLAIYFTQVSGVLLLYWIIHGDPRFICYFVASAWCGLLPIAMDRLISLVLSVAALKIQGVNRRLSSLPTNVRHDDEPSLDPAVRRGLMQTIVSRWEDTMEQVVALLGYDMLGLPLLFSLLLMSIGMVTSSSVAIRPPEELTSIRWVKLVDLATYLLRVSSLALTAGRLYREAKETATIIGAIDTTGWPIRERQRVSHLLHLSRETAQLRVCGIVSIDHSLLFTVMGNTATYLVMLLQYPILTPGKAAEVLNKTTVEAEAEAAA